MPSPSYTRINYGYRPAKHVERKMIFDAARRLERVTPLREYRYVGFGSPFFVDFKIAHRSLGIRSMVNIEREVDDTPRFEFNKPFGGVTLEFGEASEVLDSLSWSERSIVWLDYDKPLDLVQIADVRRVAAAARSESVLIVSTNAHPGNDLETRIESFRDRLGDYMPFGLSDPDLLGGWSTADLYHSVISQAINDELAIRNVGAPGGLQLTFQQWFHFRYADGARMLTIGGVLVPVIHTQKFHDLEIENLVFTRTGKDPCLIDVPNLTLREMAHLESRFPCKVEDAGLPFLNPKDISDYADVYRYYPRYADVDI